MAAEIERNQRTVVATGDTAAALVDREVFKVEEFGKTVSLKDNIYTRSNFYIRQSRPYVHGRKLTQYIHISGTQWVFLILFFISFASPTTFILAFAMSGLGLVFFLVFLQHMYVNVKTMPPVLRQPRVSNSWLQTDNAFFEITLEKYTALFAASKDAGIGVQVKGKGTVRLQIFTQAAVVRMKKCIIASTLAFLASMIMVGYSFTWAIIGVVNAQQEE